MACHAGRASMQRLEAPTVPNALNCCSLGLSFCRQRAALPRLCLSFCKPTNQLLPVHHARLCIAATLALGDRPRADWRTHRGVTVAGVVNRRLASSVPWHLCLCCS